MGLGLRIQCPRFRSRIQDLGFRSRIQDLGFRVWGATGGLVSANLVDLAFRIEGANLVDLGFRLT